MDINSLFLRNPEVGFLTDPAGTVLAATAGAERVMGYGRDELVGTELARLEEGQNIRTVLTQPATTRWNLDLVLRLRRKSGAVFTARAVAAPLTGESGDHKGWMFWAQDLSEAFERSRGRGAILEAFVDSVGAAVWSFDPGGVVLTWSGACESFFGYPRAEVVGRLRAAALFASEGDYRRVVAAVDSGGRFSGEAVMAGGGGSRRPCWLVVTQMSASPAGAPLGYAAVSLDLSERKKSEELHRLLFEEAGEAMVVVEMDSGRIVDCNRRACEIHGYAREEMIGLLISELKPERDMDRLRATMGQVLLASGRYTDAGAVHRRKDGTTFPCEVNVRLVETGGGRFTIGIIRDLEEKLRAEEFFRVLFEKTGDGQYLVEDEGLRIVEVNEAICRMLGYQRQELLSRAVPDLTPPERRHLIEGFLRRVRTEELFLRRRWVLIRKDGSEIVTDHTVSRMNVGERIYYLASARDVTAEVVAERELEESREFLEKFRDEAPDPMYVLDGEGRFLYLNEAACRVLGRPAAGLVGRGFVEVTPPDRLALHREMFERALRGEKVRFRSEVLGPGGERVPIEINGGPLRLGDRPGTMGVARLIADQLRVERELVEERSFLEHVMENAGDGFVLTDDRGVVVSVNRKAAELRGMRREDLIGRNFMEFAAAGESGRYMEFFDRLIAGQAVRLQSRVSDGTGRERFIDICANPLERGGRRFVFAIVRDVTEQVESAEAVRRARDELELANRKLQEEVAERRRAEESALASEARWQSLVANAPDIILTVDGEGKILFINRVLEGFDQNRVVGTYATAYLEPRYHDLFVETLKRVFEREEVGSYEVMGAGSGGVNAWYSVRISPIVDRGKVVAATLIATDITERKRAEERIAALAEEQALLLEHTRDFVYRHDANGIFTYVSPSVEQVSGRSMREWMTRYTEILTDNPINRKAVEYTDETLKTGRQSPPYLVEVSHKDGRRVMLEVNERAIWEGGKVVGVVGVARDVTDRKRAEERAAAQHAVTRILAESASLQEAVPRILQAMGESLGWVACVFWEVDADAGVIRCARRWHDPSFHPGPEWDPKAHAFRPGRGMPGRVWAVGEPLWVEDLAGDPDGAAAVAVGLRASFAFPIRASEGLLGVVELLDRRPRGRDHDLVAMAAVVGDQVGQFVERRRAEEGLRFQKALLESQSEAAIDGILVISTGGRVISHNRRFLSMWDLPVESLAGRSDREIRRMIVEHLADPEAFMERMRYADWHPDRESREEIPLKDGRTFESYMAPVRSLDGVRYGRVIFFRDVTGRKRAEEGLRRAVEDARRAYEELKQAQAQLIRSEKLASIGMLVSGVAHEINNPLNVIYGNLKLLEGGLGGNGDAPRRSGLRRVRRMIRDALKGAEHARRIVENFRNFSRDARTAEPVDLNKCLDETLALFGRQMPAGITVVRKFGRIPPVRCLRGQVNQVFLNLVKNAVEAMGEEGKIVLRTARKSDKVVVEVADTGCGMTAEVKRKLFEPFFTTKQVGKGLGLGLSISATIIHNHGGSISVRSRKGRGSVFRVELPVAGQ